MFFSFQEKSVDLKKVGDLEEFPPKNRSKPKEFLFLKRKIQFFFACGGLKIKETNVNLTQNQSILAKISPGGRDFFLVFRKHKKH